MKAKLAGSIATNMIVIMSPNACSSLRLFKAAMTSQSRISIALTASVTLRSRSIAGEYRGRGGSGSSSLSEPLILNRRVNHKMTRKTSGTNIAERTNGPSVSPQRFQRWSQNACLTKGRIRLDSKWRPHTLQTEKSKRNKIVRRRTRLLRMDGKRSGRFPKLMMPQGRVRPPRASIEIGGRRDGGTPARRGSGERLATCGPLLGSISASARNIGSRAGIMRRAS